MKYILLFLLAISSLYVLGQNKPRALSTEEVMYTDKINGTLKNWTKTEKKAFLSDCENLVKQETTKYKSYCKCAMKSMMTGINYKSYAESSDYQKGYITGLHGAKNCNNLLKEF